MTQKFGRSFRVTVDMKDGKPPIIVTMPFTIRFWIERYALSDLNNMSLDIYNLSEANRARIYQDYWNMGLDPSVPQDTSPGRTVTIELGYQNLYMVFTGLISSASSAREGTNIITRVEGLAGFFDVRASQTFQTLESGQSTASILKYLVAQLPSIKLGALGSFPTIMQRPVVLNGATWNLLKKYSDGNVYIDNGKIYILQPNETVGSIEYTINDSTGLLETPRRTGGSLVVTTLLEPGVDMFQQIKLQSSINPLYNGVYRINGVRHEGIISGAVNGDCRTTLTLQHPDLYNNFVQVPQQ
jgi:hypothetical protein